jgi:hypothetical protein
MTALYSSLLRPALTDNLVIPTRGGIEQLLKYIDAYGIKEEYTLHELVRALTKERDAEAELSLLCVEPLEERMHDTFDGMIVPTEAMEQYSNLLYHFGQYLFKQFRRHQVYQGGYLPYHFHSRLSHDLVLTRFMVPQLNPPKYKTPDRFDLDAFYDRFELR